MCCEGCESAIDKEVSTKFSFLGTQFHVHISLQPEQVIAHGFPTQRVFSDARSKYMFVPGKIYSPK